MAGLIGVLAGRFVRREGRPPPGVNRVIVGAALVLVVALALVMGGAEHLAPPILVLVSSLVLLAAVAVRMFPPTIAVSVTGVSLGVASLFTVLAVTSGFELELTRRIAQLNGHVLLTKYGLSFYEYDEMADELEKDPNVAMASPFVWGSAAIVVEERNDPDPAIAIVKGLDPQRVPEGALLGHTLRGTDLKTGLRAANPGTKPGAVLGYRLAERLRVEVGQHVVLVSPEALDGTRSPMGGAPRRGVFEVMGLMETGVSEFDQSLVLVHLTGAQSLLFAASRVSGIELELHDPAQAEALATGLDAELNAGRRVPLFRTGTWEQYSQSTLTVIRQVRAVVSVVLGLMVLVAGGSLVASLLLLVRRKRRQIAILGALGAARSRVFWAFEATGVLAGVYGAIGGLSLGGLFALVLIGFRYPLDADVYPIDHLPVAFSIWDAIIPAVMAIVVCATVSGPLAFLASRVRPINVLRE